MDDARYDARYDELVDDLRADFAQARARAAVAPPLVARIPPPRLPTVLGLGSTLQQTPFLHTERELAQHAVDARDGVFYTFEAATPPPADCVYSSVDQGVSSPDFLRASMHNVPATAALRARSQLPLALLVRPLALAEVPTADFALPAEAAPDEAEPLPPRCARCRAYMNPSMRFVAGGVRFACNLCAHETPTPREYYAPTDADGRRVDWAERPELAFGTYDFIVGRAYGAEGSPFRHVFVCQTYTDAANGDVLGVFAAALQAALPLMRDGSEVAIVLFDKYVRALRLVAGAPQLLVFLPKMGVLPPDVFTKIGDDSRAQLLRAVEALPELVPPAALAGARECALGETIEAVLECVASANGGARITATLATLPTGDFALRAHDPALYTLDTSAHAPADTVPLTYTRLAERVRRAGCGLDVFVVGSRGPIALKTLTHVAEHTGGRLVYFPRFVPEKDLRAVITAFLAVAAEPQTARHAELGMRCSLGLRVDVGKVQPGTEAAPAFFDSHTSQLMLLKYDAPLDLARDVHFQTALLYTDSAGARRVRVCNLLCGVTTQFKKVLKFVDADVVLAAVTRQAVAESRAPSDDAEKHLRSVRAAVMHKIEHIFGAARRFADPGLPLSQMLMPTSLRQLLMLGLALAKQPALGARPFSADFRAHNAARLVGATPNELALLLYPRVYDVGTQRPLPARYSDLETGSGLCLVFTGALFLLYVSKNADPQLLDDVWGVRRREQVPAYTDEPPQLDTPASRFVQDLMASLPLRVGLSWCQLQVVRPELDGSEHTLRALLTEDAVDDCPSYERFMARVHERAKVYEEKEKWF